MDVINPALGVNLKDYNPEDILKDKKWRVTEKIDGVRRLFYKSVDNKVTAYSRTGKKDIWLPHINKWFEQRSFPSNKIYDCELVDRDLYFSDVDSFILRTETNSKVSQEYPDNKKDIMALCFDIFNPSGDMNDGVTRTQKLMAYFFGSLVTEPVLPIPILGYIYGNDQVTISKLMNRIKNQNGEGLMLMNMASPYIPGRSKELVKVKRLNEFKGKVMHYELGRPDSKISGGISALICNVEGCNTLVRVGTGFSHQLRQELATDEVIGRIIEIEAFGYSKDKNGDVSLSMPVFKQFVKEE